MTTGEGAALQTFPVGFTFAGTGRQQWTQIGDAVPPVFARALFAEILAGELERT